ncbi:MAG: hypothetical protein OHK0046_16400 [Anaerolineae bacterium]
MIRMLLGLLILFVIGGAAMAQDGPQVEITAEDGLTLIGDFYPAESDGSAVLLLHMLGSNRGAWEPFIAPLQEAGFHVLAADMRGHGATGGSRDWAAAETDIQSWFDWLKAQDNVTSVAVVGGSIGGNMALIGCANEPDCTTAIALSPGLNYSGVMPESAVVEGLAERSVLLVGARNDGRVADDIIQMATNTPGTAGLMLYPGRAHGTNLFRDQGNAFINLLITWLNGPQT